MSSPLYACAVCFGGTDNAGLVSGLNWGIFILMGFTFSILAALMFAVYKIEQGRARTEAPHLNKEAWTKAE